MTTDYPIVGADKDLWGDKLNDVLARIEAKADDAVSAAVAAGDNASMALATPRTAAATAQTAASDAAASAAAAATSAAAAAATSDTALASALVAEGSQTQTVLNATYARRVTATDTLFATLDEGTRSTGIQVLSDSTGNENWEWPYLIGAAIGADHPDYTVRWRTWSDATQDYAAPVTIQSGAAGDRYMDLVNGSNPRRLANAAAPHLTGTIDVRMDLEAADWTPANSYGSTILVSEAGGTGNWGWYFSINTSGVLQFVGSTNGTDLDVIMNANAVTGLTDGARSWVRCVFTPNDGAGNRTAKFYRSTDGITWTQIGTTVTTAGAVVLSDRIAASTNSAYLLGGVGAATNSTAFKFYEVDIRDGENGPGIVPRLPDLWSVFGAGTTQPVVGAPILTITSGAHPGATISYLDDATRKKRLTPDYGNAVAFLSASHNQTRSTGRVWYAEFLAWVNSVRTLLGVPLVAVTQNPQRAAATYSAEHARRRLELVGFGPGMAVHVIDTYAAFLANPAWSTELMADDVHPNAAGQAVWRDAVLAAF